MNHKLYFRAFYFLVTLTFLTPLVFWRGFYLPFTSAKLLFFYILVELALSFYIYIVLRFPEYRPRFSNPIIMAFAVFLLTFLTAGWFGLDFGRSFWGSLNRMIGLFFWMHLFLWFLYLQLLFKGKANFVSNFFKAIVWVAAISSLVAVGERIGIFDLGNLFLPRSASLFGNPIFFASFLVIPIFISGYLAYEYPKNRYLYMALGALNFVGVILSGTRGALVGIGAGILTTGLLYVILANKGHRRRLVVASLIILVLTGSLFVIFGKRFVPQDSFTYRFLEFKDHNAQSRIIQWGMALKGFKESPWLGVGPDNYYYISNKYFEPKLYELGSQWSDKPHNSFLEILATSGIVGFVAYILLIAATVGSLIKAYLRRLIDAPSLSLFVGLFAAYLVQGLFVFDTVSASVTFVLFLSVAAHLWQETRPIPAAKGNELSHKWTWGLSGIATLVMLGTLFGVTAGIAGLVFHLGRALALDVSKPDLAKNHFDKGLLNANRTDMGGLALKYFDFASDLVLLQENKSDNTELLNSALDRSRQLLESEVEKQSKNYEHWVSLANVISMKDSFNKRSIDQKAFELVEAGRQLAPNRAEADLTLVNFAVSQGQLAEAKTMLESMLTKYPGNASVFWKLSVVQRAFGNVPEAALFAEKAIDAGLKISGSSQFDWLTRYYFETNNHEKAIKLGLKILIWEPKDVPAHALLAEAYAKVGDKENAIKMAKKLAQLDPKYKELSEKFIQNLR